ncbi:MAG: apolipoprotein N-acyltransferase [Gammaproteobacteria bacterium]
MWFFPILSGVLIGTSYIPFPPWALLFCWVPLWIFWKRQSHWAGVFRGGWTTAFVLTLIGFNWVAYTLHEFAHLPWPFAVLGLLLYAALAQWYIPVVGVVWFWLQKRLKVSDRLTVGLMGLICALGDRNSVTLFDWNFGYAWYGAGLPLYQWAEWIGFSGLSTLTVLLNIPCYYAWQLRRKSSGWALFAAVIVVFAALNVGGLWLKARLPRPDASLNVLLVQGNIGNEEKSAAELGQGFRGAIVAKYFGLTDAALGAESEPQLDLMVWPEAAFPSLIDSVYGSASYLGALQRFVAERGIPLVTGGYGVDAAKKQITNSLFALDARGGLTSPHYSKTKLLAFGEYIPGSEWFPLVKEWLPPIGEYARGPGPTVLLRVKDLLIGPQICYESLFPEFSRGLADLGAQLIINVTNDSWYGAWQEPFQHLYMTLARAVETRRPVIRATNTGISSVALASGEILKRSPIYREWTGRYHVPYLKQPPQSIYQRWFWVVPAGLWVALAVLVGISLAGRDATRVKR